MPLEDVNIHRIEMQRTPYSLVYHAVLDCEEVCVCCGAVC
jgi:hypothetical protein